MLKVKFRLPYSGVVALVVGLIWHSLVIAAIGGIAVELLTGLILFIKLRSFEEFDFDSFYGILLTQYTGGAYLDITDMAHLIGLRVVAYVFLWFELFLFVPFILCLIPTVVHIEKSMGE